MNGTEIQEMEERTKIWYERMSSPEYTLLKELLEKKYASISDPKPYKIMSHVKEK